jgi:hypothetical protein
MSVIGRIAKHLTFSNVIACLALFVALGGSVYAAGKISGKQIKPNSLPGNRIKPKTVTANRIKPNSLGGKQINEEALTGVSAAALADVQYQAATARLASNGRPTTVTANCAPGSYAIGGGATVSNDERGYVNDSGPSPLRTGWTATGFGWYSGGAEMTVTAVCVVVQKPGGSVANVTGETPPGGPVYEFGE